MNIFQRAVKQNLGFASSKGVLSVVDLYQLPLQTTQVSRPSLESVAQAVNKKLQESGVESFVEAPSTLNATYKLQLDIIKAVIADKQADNAAVRNASATKAKKQQLAGLIADKQNDALGAKSIVELQAEYDAL